MRFDCFRKQFSCVRASNVTTPISAAVQRRAKRVQCLHAVVPFTFAVVSYACVSVMRLHATGHACMYAHMHVVLVTSMSNAAL